MKRFLLFLIFTASLAAAHAQRYTPFHGYGWEWFGRGKFDTTFSPPEYFTFDTSFHTTDTASAQIRITAGQFWYYSYLLHKWQQVGVGVGGGNVDLTNYYTKGETNSALNDYLLITSANATYATISSLNNYLLKTDSVGMLAPYMRTTDANATFQTKGNYLTSESDPVFAASAANGINSTNVANWNTAFGWGNHASAGYELSTHAASTYQPIGSYVPTTRTITINGIEHDLSTNASFTINTGSGGVSNNADSLGGQPATYYETLTHAAATYQPIGSYLTQTTGDARYSLLSHTHTFASLTSKPTTIGGYGITDAFTQSAADALYSPLAHTHTFASLTSKPATLSGYGITDAYPLTGNPSNFLTGITSSQVTTALGFTPYNATNPSSFITASALTPYALLSNPTFTGTPKIGSDTIAKLSDIRDQIANDTSKSFITDGVTVIGNGKDDNPVRVNTSVIATIPYVDSAVAANAGAGSSTTVINNLTSTDATAALSAAQGKVLKDLVDGNTATITATNTRTAHNLGSFTRSARDAISSPVVGDMVFNTDDGWYDYYDAFWGWMPLAITNGWKKHYGWEYFNDFLNSGSDNVLSSATGNGGTASFNVSLGSITSESSSYVALNLLTNANARAGYTTASTTVLLGSGATAYECRIQINTLSDSLNRYELLAGFLDANSTADQTDGVYLLYDEGGVTTGSTASGNWQLVTSSNSVRTFLTSSSTVAAATWYNLRIEVNTTGTLATFYVNGSSIGTIATNIPNTSLRTTGFGVSTLKSIGTSARLFELEYIGAKQKFTTAR